MTDPMKTILLTNKYSGIPLQIVEDEVPEGFGIRFLTEQTQDALINEVFDMDYILAGGRLKISREVLDEAKNLRMIQRSGVGLDALDLDAIKEKGIPLYVNQGINAESVAEHTLTLMLACLRRLPIIDQNTKAGIWKKQEQGIQTAELKGKTVGIIGMGNIAKTLVSMLKPFQVRILYYNLFQEPIEYENENSMRYVSIDELLRNSDIVTIHCALTDETRQLINAESVQKMKDGSVLINTARGEIVDPQVIADALKSGKLAFVGLDVHGKEPIPEDYPLKHIGNVILTPHVAGVTADSFRAMMHSAFRNIALFDKKQYAEIEQYKYI